MRQGMFTLSGAPGTTSHFGYYTSVNFGLLHLVYIIFHILGSPLSYHTLISDLMWNLHIHNACIYSFYYDVSPCP